MCSRRQPSLVLANAYAGVGGAVAWALLNTFYMMIGIPLTYRRILQGESIRWFKEDLIFPAARTVAVVATGRILLLAPLTPIATILFLLGLLICSSTVAAIVAPQTRLWLFDLKRSLATSKFR
jgi:hypothetical protein